MYVKSITTDNLPFILYKNCNTMLGIKGMGGVIYTKQKSVMFLKNIH